jgi:hypothetical protein
MSSSSVISVDLKNYNILWNDKICFERYFQYRKIAASGIFLLGHNRVQGHFYDTCQTISEVF